MSHSLNSLKGDHIASCRMFLTWIQHVWSSRQHLVALSCLKAADRSLKDVRDWTYYASLATCWTVPRDLCKSLFKARAEKHGAQLAKDNVRKLWPKDCSGRWTGCDKPESRSLQYVGDYCRGYEGRYWELRL